MSPEQGRNHHRGEDDQATHGWCSRLGEVRLRGLQLGRLADLSVAKHPDDTRPQPECDEQRCHRRRRRPEGDNPHYTEPRRMVEPIKDFNECVEHSFCWWHAWTITFLQ